MSKLRAKNRSEVEYLRGVVKEQDKLIRRLYKKLKGSKKLEHMYEDHIQNLGEDSQVIEEQPNKCPSCNKGHLEELDLVHIKIKNCNQCDYSEKYGKKKKEKEITTEFKDVANSKTKKRK